MKLRPLTWFLLAELLVSLLIFRDALWGKALLAPLDIPAALWTKYRFVDPNSSEVPANHYAIDQILADVPLQWTIHQAYQRGKIPWWDPYSYGGMAMLGDGHTNGIDWSRVALDCLLPFELAYNWTRVVHFALIGLGMFLLLGRFGAPLAIRLPMALTYQFCGFFTLAFQHPFLEGTFLYYPFLWLAWDAYSRRPQFRQIALASVWVAGALFAGDPQVDAYLALFGGAFLLGYGGWRWEAWKRLAPAMAASGILGACLAAPIWLEYFGLFFQGTRSMELVKNHWSWLCGVFSLSSVYPWMLGTFRTFDAGKLLGQNSLGFSLFIGCAGCLLAACGARWPCPNPALAKPRRTALWLVVLYLFILSTPLLDLFYTRSAGLAVMGLTVLAAAGACFLWESKAAFPKLSRGVIALTVVLALATNLGAWLVFPRIKEQLRAFTVQYEHKYANLDAAPKLREFQINNLPGEISFANPETVLGCLGLVALAVLLSRPAWRRQPSAWVALLALNLAPVLLFANRYVPHGDLALWHRLLEGGPEQRKVMDSLGSGPSRMFEFRPGQHEAVFPGAMANLYRVRNTEGYSGFRPPSLAFLPMDEVKKILPQTVDWIYESTDRGQAAGAWRSNAIPGLARFHWIDPNPRRFKVRDVELDEIHLEFEPGKSGPLFWGDSHYPGWQAWADGKPLNIAPFKPCFNRLEIGGDTRLLVLRYRPRFLRLGMALAIGGMLILAMGGGLCAWRRTATAKEPGFISLSAG